MRRVKAGNLADADLSPIGYIRFDAFLPADLVLRMDEILTGLTNVTIKTGVTAEKP